MNTVESYGTTVTNNNLKVYLKNCNSARYFVKQQQQPKG